MDGSTAFPSGHAVKVSYNRPFITKKRRWKRSSEDWLFHAEYPMIRWLERNGITWTMLPILMQPATRTWCKTTRCLCLSVMMNTGQKNNGIILLLQETMKAPCFFQRQWSVLENKMGKQYWRIKHTWRTLQVCCYKGKNDGRKHLRQQMWSITSMDRFVERWMQSAICTEWRLSSWECTLPGR